MTFFKERAKLTCASRDRTGAGRGMAVRWPKCSAGAGCVAVRASKRLLCVGYSSIKLKWRKKEQNGIGDALALPHALLWVLGSGEERVGHSLTYLPSFGQTRKWNSQKESTRTGLSLISCLPPFSPFSTREEGDLLKSPQIGPTCLKKFSSTLAP